METFSSANILAWHCHWSMKLQKNSFRACKFQRGGVTIIKPHTEWAYGECMWRTHFSEHHQRLWSSLTTDAVLILPLTRRYQTWADCNKHNNFTTTITNVRRDDRINNKNGKNDNNKSFPTTDWLHSFLIFNVTWEFPFFLFLVSFHYFVSIHGTVR